MDYLGVIEKLAERSHINPDSGCWEYESVNSGKYGQITIDGKFYYTHRLAAWAFYGFKMDPKYCVCHKCDNPRCWKFDHIFISDIAGNNKDMVKKGRAKNRYSDATHCVNGHEFTYSNTYYAKRGKHNFVRRRQCKMCKRLRSIERNERRKASK